MKTPLRIHKWFCGANPYTAIASLGGVMLLLAAFFSKGFYQLDEHYQILEFAAFKLGLTKASKLPWEYAFAMRPTFQPFVVYLLSKALYWLDLFNPFVVAFLLRLIAGLLTWIGMKMLWRHYVTEFSSTQGALYYTFLSFCTWFVIYVGVRFSSEGVSASLFAIGFVYLQKVPKPSFIRCILGGIILGASFVCRYQCGFLIFGLMAAYVFLYKDIQKASLVMIGVLLMVLLGVVIDTWFYGHFISTAWNYINQNILQDKVSYFGVEPWWYYIQQAVEVGVPPFSLVMVCFPLVFFVSQPKHILTWVLIPFLFIHLVIGHKELRFLFPVFLFVPFLVAKGAQFLEARYAALSFSHKWVQTIVCLFCLYHSVLAFYICFAPSDNTVTLYESVYDHLGSDKRGVLYYTPRDPYGRLVDVMDGLEKGISFYKSPLLTTN